jgi:hypothetical protein
MKNNTALQNSSNIRHINFWIALTVLVGITLRTIQYLGNSSMWFDELTSALNIQSRTFYQLATQPLDYNQVAPVGFLLGEKLATYLFGENDLAFRFFPWLWSVASLIMFVLIAQRFLRNFYLLAAVLLYAVCLSQWWYAGEGKQYSGDVAFSVFLVWASLTIAKANLKKGMVWFLALGGCIAILSSLPAIPLSLFLLGILTIVYYRNRLPASKFDLLIIGSFWLMSVLLHVYYVKFVISSAVKDAMSAYWSHGFPPITSVANYAGWFPKKIYSELNFFLFVWGYQLVTPLAYIGMVLLMFSLFGIIYLTRSKKVDILILFSSLLIALVLAFAYILPFDERVGLYASWPFIISGMAGIAYLQQWQPRIFRPALSIPLAFCLALPCILIPILVPYARPPVYAQPSQPVLRELKKQMQPGDILYVYYKARHALKFYGPKEGISGYQVGKYYDSIIPYLREVDGLRGNKRVWFFYTAWTYTQPFPDSIKHYMGHVIGKEIGHIPDPFKGQETSEATAYLYDLSQK